MKIRNSLLRSALVLVMLLCALAMVGCKTTPARQAYIGVDAATDAINGITAAATVSPSFKSQLPKLAPYVDAVYAAQKSLDAAISNKDVNLAAYQSALTDAVTTLLNQKAAVLKASP